MDGTVAKLRLLLRAELLRGRIAARALAVRASVYAMAALFAVLGVVMLVLAAYFALSERLGPVYAALLTGLGLGLLALFLALLARPLSRGRNAAAADELEQLIRAELMQELHALETRITGLGGRLGGPLGLLAFGIGLASAWSPRLRAFLASLLR